MYTPQPPPPRSPFSAARLAPSIPIPPSPCYHPSMFPSPFTLPLLAALPLSVPLPHPLPFPRPPGPLGRVDGKGWVE